MGFHSRKCKWSHWSDSQWLDGKIIRYFIIFHYILVVLLLNYMIIKNWYFKLLKNHPSLPLFVIQDQCMTDKIDVLFCCIKFLVSLKINYNFPKSFLNYRQSIIFVSDAWIVLGMPMMVASPREIIFFKVNHSLFHDKQKLKFWWHYLTLFLNISR